MNPVSFLEGPHINPEFMITSTTFFTQGDFVNFIAGLEGYQKQIDDAIGRMNRSIQYRHTYYNTSVLKVPEQIEKLLSVRPEDSKLYKPFVEKGHNNTSIHHSIKNKYWIDSRTLYNVRSKRSFQEIPNLPVAIKLKPTDGPSMYYSGPADGSRPGTFYLNLFRPKEIWSRERAIDFMLNYTAYSRSDLTNEIDRYLTWPGQAYAYKIGELKIKELRAKAEKELGKRFDIKDFHLVVLKNGAMPLRLLEKLVDQWIDSVKKSPNYESYVTCKGCCCGINMFVVIISLLILFVHTTQFYHGHFCI